MIKYSSLLFIYFLSAGSAKAGNTLVAENLLLESQNKVVATTNVDSLIPSFRLIVPGKSIGLSSLNEKENKLYKSLGKPGMEDAAMGGKNLASWYSKPVIRSGDTVINETNIYFTTPNFGMRNAEPSAKVIRVTSSRFVTKQQVSVGSTLGQVRKYFPKIKKIASYVSPKTKQEVLIYDDLASGIAFEIDRQQHCTGITVHKPGDEPSVIYYGLFGEVKTEESGH